MKKPLRRAVGYANWLFNPFHGLGAEEIYGLLGTDAPTSRGLYLNLGYWAEADNLDDACEDMVRLVGDAARLSAADTVLDCGFGFAEQDIFWARSARPRGIVGLNITPSQVLHARERVRRAGVEDIVDLRTGSATDMPFDDASFDVVIALESAFHFQTRERFLREAHRVLRPGGRVVVADIIPEAPVSGSAFPLPWRLTASKFAIPAANAYPVGRYRDVLADCGFEQRSVRSIRDDVYPPLHAFLRASPQTLQRLHPLTRLAGHLALRFDAPRLFRGLDYVIAAARKPAGQTPSDAR